MIPWAIEHASVLINNDGVEMLTHSNKGIELSELIIKIEMFCTFLGEPAFSKHVQLINVT